MTELTLWDLDAQFLAAIDETHFHNVYVIQAADGVCFLCPKCYLENGGEMGTHSVICWSPKVDPKMKPSPGRWNLEGTSIDDLTLTAAQSSIQLSGGCSAHFFVEKGKIRMA